MPASAQVASDDAASLLRNDHRKVEALFAQYESVDEREEKQKIAHEICRELIVHTYLEEEIFYPACRERSVDEDLMDEAQVEHDSAKVLIADLLRESAGADFYDAKVSVLREQIKHHVKEEEHPTTGILAKAKSAGVDMNELGRKLQARKQELMSESERLRAPRPVSLHITEDNAQENQTMASQYRRDRDDQGRFMSDDDRGGSRGRGPSRDEQGRFESDDRGGSGRYGRSRDDDYDDRSGGRNRDDDGRSSRSRSDNDYRSSRSRDDGDDGRGHGQGGWFGDSRGHADAAREGWRNRDDDGRSSRGRSDDDYRSSRSRDDEDGRGQGRGWFGDSRGHAEAAREGWRNRDDDGRSSRNRSDDDYRSSRSRDDDDGRGQGRGWFGDSRGHAEAAREGWRNRDDDNRGSRGRSDDDNRGMRSRSDDDYRSSRSRDDDDDGRGRGHGGWFGDSRGHAEAARRGWQNR